jgi:hypothetical protein
VAFPFSKEGKVFFFEKKKQKAFVCSHLPLGRYVVAVGYQCAKVGSFFQKRTSFILDVLPDIHSHPQGVPPPARV